MILPERVTDTIRKIDEGLLHQKKCSDSFSFVKKGIDKCVCMHYCINQIIQQHNNTMVQRSEDTTTQRHKETEAQRRNDTMTQRHNGAMAP
ncbi:MAG: hypothetical protein IJ860_01490 [Eubacterium sp.]|nr:hypothetical protein [Eubacterium sp.]